MEEIEIVVNKEEEWHLNLLSSISHKLVNLTLTIRSRQNGVTTDMDLAHPRQRIVGEVDNDLRALSCLIFNMPVLKRLQIYFETAGQFEVRSTSLEYLKFRGSKWGASLALNECMCPYLKTMDISVFLDQIDDDTIINLLPPFVENLTLHIARGQTSVIKTVDSVETDSTMGEEREFEEDDVDDFHNLSLIVATMPQLKTLNLLPTPGTSFIINQEVLGEYAV